MLSLSAVVRRSNVPIVQRSGRGPFKAETRVRFPVGTPTLFDLGTWSPDPLLAHSHNSAPHCAGQIVLRSPGSFAVAHSLVEVRADAPEPNPLDFAHYPVEVSMTDRFVSLRRIVALSVAITLFASPIAAAQSPDAAPPSAASANTALLSPAAFARLIQPPAADVGTAPVMAESPPPSLLRQITTAMVHQAQAGPTKAPQQKSWISRNKVTLGWTIAAGIIGAGLILWLNYAMRVGD